MQFAKPQVHKAAQPLRELVQHQPISGDINAAAIVARGRRLLQEDPALDRCLAAGDAAARWPLWSRRVGWAS